jgi:hypothetical protein
MAKEKNMKRIRVVILLSVLITTLFGQVGFSATEEGNSYGTFLILGVTSSYFNYEPTELKTFTSDINKNLLLLGFTFGFLSDGFLMSFSYQQKVFSNAVYQINDNFEITHNLDMYNLEIGYLWQFFNGVLKTGTYLLLSLDTTSIKIFKNIDINYSFSDWTVKNLYSRTLAIGGGIKIFITRYLKLSVSYQYAFPSSLYYEGVAIKGTESFQPSGLMFSITLGL